VVEQRQHQRAPIHLVVRVVHEGHEFTAVGRDISIGGVFVATDSKVPFGARVTLHIDAQGSLPPLTLPAVCRWSSPDGIGMQFGLIGARETHAITELCRATT
jgi:PilZ domain